MLGPKKIKPDFFLKKRHYHNPMREILKLIHSHCLIINADISWNLFSKQDLIKILEKKTTLPKEIRILYLKVVQLLPKEKLRLRTSSSTIDNIDHCLSAKNWKDEGNNRRTLIKVIIKKSDKIVLGPFIIRYGWVLIPHTLGRKDEEGEGGRIHYQTNHIIELRADHPRVELLPCFFP